MSIITKNFGKRLKYIRNLRNYTQEKLAENIGINLRQLARIESGESFITAETLYQICKILDIIPAVLFDFGISEEILMTGINNNMHFSVIRSGNLIKLVNIQKEDAVLESIQNIDDNMSKLAKKFKEDIIIDEYENGKISLSKIYKPDGTTEVINKKRISELYKKFTKKLALISDDNKKLEFLNVAYNALDDKNSFEQLKLLIKGLELKF